MKTTNERSGLSRRNVLAGASTVGFVAASVVLLPNPAAQSPLAIQPDATGTAAKGYRLTDHVKHYYRTARI